jgi:hypothetical protein
VVGTSVAKPPARLSLVPALLVPRPPRRRTLHLSTLGQGPPQVEWHHFERQFSQPLHHFEDSPSQVSARPLTRAPDCPSHVLPSIG